MAAGSACRVSIEGGKIGSAPRVAFVSFSSEQEVRDPEPLLPFTLAPPLRAPLLPPPPAFSSKFAPVAHAQGPPSLPVPLCVGHCVLPSFAALGV